MPVMPQANLIISRHFEYDRGNAAPMETHGIVARWDALLCPVSMVTTFPHCPVDIPLQVDGETVNYWRAVGHTALFNFTGHPSVAIPIGRDTDGLLIGAQLVVRRWGEEKLLVLGMAARMAEVAGYF
jgi:amidase